MWKCKGCGHNKFRIFKTTTIEIIESEISKDGGVLVDFFDSYENIDAIEYTCEECDIDSDSLEDIANWEDND